MNRCVMLSMFTPLSGGHLRPHSLSLSLHPTRPVVSGGPKILGLLGTSSIIYGILSLFRDIQSPFPLSCSMVHSPLLNGDIPLSPFPSSLFNAMYTYMASGFFPLLPGLRLPFPPRFPLVLSSPSSRHNQRFPPPQSPFRRLSPPLLLFHLESASSYSPIIQPSDPTGEAHWNKGREKKPVVNTDDARGSQLLTR